jgi:benzoyl-CoA reductase/2-hydroxyglutaryl-CoA dehydratase subunit BcrC/BadD/HgdB
MNEQKPQKKGRALEASYEARKILTEYWDTMHKGKKEGKLVAWVSGNAPAELLYSFGILPAYPENYAAVLASKQMSAVFCEMAEEKGFSKDLCSYSRINLGDVLWDRDEKPEMPFGGLPEPDLLVTTRIPCITQVKWWEVIRDRYNIPMFVLDAPFSTTLETSQKGLKYVHDQMMDLIAFLEGITRNRINEDDFIRRLELSDKAAGLWHEIMDLRASVPCPVGPREMFGNVFPLVAMLGTEVPVEFYTLVRNEIREKVAAGSGVIENERIRLILDNIPLWHHLELVSGVEDKNAIFVLETYLRYVWGGRIDLDNPYWGYAEKVFTDVWLNSSIDVRSQLLLSDIKKFSVDGVVFLSNRSCKRYTLGQLELKKQIEDELAIPSLVLECDMADPGGYSREQAVLRMEALLELIGVRKGL